MASEPDPYDRLAEAAARVATARASDKDALWIAGLAGGGAFLWLSTIEKLEEAWALLVIVGAFGLAYRIAKIVLYRMRGLGQLSLFGNLLPSSVPLTDAPGAATGSDDASAIPLAPEVRSATVARLPFTRTPPDVAVVLSELLAVETLRAGRVGTANDDLPLGVLMVTSAGLAFMPEARGKLEDMFGDIPGALVGDFAGKLLPPLEQLQGIKDAMEIVETPPKLSEWMDTALAQKHAFVIAWGDLVGVVASPVSVLLERRSDAGEAAFRMLIDGSQLVTALMQRRIGTELREAVTEFVLRPKFDELLPQVQAELANAPPSETGEDSETRARNIAAERTMLWFAEAPPVEPLLREKMQPALEGYASVPGVVAQQPWLFAPEGKLEAN